MHAPCPLNDKVELWDRLKVVIEQNRDNCICMTGDFNSFRNIRERVGRKNSKFKLGCLMISLKI